ncbi:MAG: response regulator [Desulfobacterales bacterium]|nr:response regulator [Desulfobacterales bacterium]
MQIHKLSTKLTAAFLMVGLIPFMLIGGIALINAQNALTDHTMSHLESLRDAKKMSIQQFFKTQLGNITTLATVGSVITATEMLEEAFSLKGKQTENNVIWKALSKRYTPAMHNYINTHGYKDLYIISPDGDIVYSVTGQSDLGQNVREGPLKDSPLGKCFTYTLERGAALTDFELYKPHNNNPALFAGAMVKRGDLVGGVVAVYIPIEMINTIMLERSGLGRTGATYLVGSDKLMRSDSYQDPANHSVQNSLLHPDQGRLDSEAIHLALSDQTGGKMIDDYRGVPVVCAFTPLRFENLTWALIAEIDKSEAFASVKMLRDLVGLVGFIGITAIVFVSLLISRRISLPLVKLTRATEEISRGRFEDFSDPTLMTSKDEISLLATSFNTMTGRLKRSMEALMNEIAERKHLTTILDSTTDMVSIATPDARVTYMNRAGLEMLGWGAEEAMGSQTISDAHPQWAIDIVANTGIPIAIKDNVWMGETAMLHRDGREIPVSQVIMSHKSPEGELQYLSTIVRDISDQKQAEMALRESHERFLTVLGGIEATVYVSDMETYEVLFANKNMIESFGKDMTGEICYEVFREETGPCPHCTNDQLVDGHGDPADVCVWQGKNPVTRKWYINYDRAIEWTDGRLVKLQIATDITDLKRMEAQLQQTQKFKAIGTLAGGIAHDFNNLLMGIQGRTSLMSMDLEPTHSHCEHINAIEDYIQSATELTRQLLGLARGGKYEVKPIELNTLIEHSATMFGRTKKEIQIHLKMCRPPPVVAVDQNQIEQVFLNLFVNAWQAMPDGGELYLESKQVVLDKESAGQYQLESGLYAQVTVMDTGVGMNQSTRRQVFDPFFTTKEKSRGTGLGLASAYGIVKNHDGIITVDSEVRKGTTFNIYLPLSSEKVRCEVPLEGTLIKGSETVLLVDDEEMILEVGKAMLEKLGYQVLVANGGKQALEKVQAEDGIIDLAIIDLIMPGMEGGQVFDRIREVLPRMPVMLSSGYAINGKAEKIMQRGCNGFIQKPFNISKLSKKIRQILDETKNQD